MQNALIILDRDGVLNKLLIREDGSTDSPMTMNEIEVFPWVKEQISIITKELKYRTVIATNQPAFAKGKISKENLLNIHHEIIEKAFPKAYYAEPFNSLMCLHKREDNCECRKPKTVMLDYTFNICNNFRKKHSWMVGDRATDIIAGYNSGLNTALLGPSVASDLDVLKEKGITPTYHGTDLRDFVEKLRKIDYEFTTGRLVRAAY